MVESKSARAKTNARSRKRRAFEIEPFGKLFRLRFSFRLIADLGVLDQIVNVALHALLVQKLTQSGAFGLIVHEALCGTNTLELHDVPA